MNVRSFYSFVKGYKDGILRVTMEDRRVFNIKISTLKIEIENRSISAIANNGLNDKKILVDCDKIATVEIEL